ncbi:hypothetical protein NFI96_010306 [Prochilodus magdalenae]|nr:hypothetical protein NFI96_010306 [Prochilodus magdalenae]
MLTVPAEVTGVNMNMLCTQKREEEERQKGEEEVRRVEEKRARELYISLEQERKESEQDNKEWEEQLRRSKAADKEMTRKARWARDEHKRQSSRVIEQGSVAGLSLHFQQQPHISRRHSATIEPTAKSSPCREDRPRPSLQPAAPPLYRRRQSRRHSTIGTQPLTDSCIPRPAGIITREESEKLLMNEAEGSFLVRVSERIWGYTLSYRTASGFKHFLIDASGDYYSFLGVEQNRHATLADLINFHKVASLDQNSITLIIKSALTVAAQTTVALMAAVEELEELWLEWRNWRNCGWNGGTGGTVVGMEDLEELWLEWRNWRNCGWNGGTGGTVAAVEELEELWRQWRNWRNYGCFGGSGGNVAAVEEMEELWLEWRN